MLNFFFSGGNLELPKRGKTRVTCGFSFASDWSNGGESFNDQLQSEVRK